MLQTWCWTAKSRATLKPEIGIRNLEPETGNHNPESGIRNPESGVDTEQGRKCHREQGLRRCQPPLYSDGHAPHIRCPKTDLARPDKLVFPNRYKNNSRSTLFPD